MESTTALKPVIEMVDVIGVPDTDADTSYLEQAEFADRLAAYRNGDFGFIGVQAVAQLKFRTELGGWLWGPEVRSPGLWCIEDDSDREYLDEIGNEQKDELREMLLALNVDPDEIERAFSA
jgi:hypothetical protein